MTVLRHFRVALLCVLVPLLPALTGCRLAWEVRLTGPDGQPLVIDRGTLDTLAEFAEEHNREQDIPLERVLALHGYQVIERINTVDTGGVTHTFEWAAVADDAWWLDDGRLAINGQIIAADSIDVETSEMISEVEAHITDLAPTAALALGIPAPAQASGHPLVEESASHVLLLFLDGFGYIRYTEALDAGLIPRLSELGPPLLGLTTYPPITTVSSASLLTGAPPAVHGVDRRGIRKTEVETLFDVADGAGLDVVAVEGETLAFALRGAEFVLSGDRDGNGSTDDNVLANALAVLAEGMPDLLYVHFHGIDDAGHSFGPGAVEEEAVVREVDSAVGQILDAVPPDTLVIIFADHGMHRVDESGRLGNHGHLIARDMFIPIFVRHTEE